MLRSGGEEGTTPRLSALRIRKIASEQGTAGRCKWYQKRAQGEMLDDDVARQLRPTHIWRRSARFRVWLRFLAISDLVASGWLRPVGSTPLESFVNRFATGPSPSDFTLRRPPIC